MDSAIDPLTSGPDHDGAALCAGCADLYLAPEGWDGLCPSCCALVEEHELGAHEVRPVTACLPCLAAGGPALGRWVGAGRPA